MSSFDLIYTWLAGILFSQSLALIFVYSVVGSTIIPFISEFNVYLSVREPMYSVWIIGLVAVIGSTIGAALSYWMGTLFPKKKANSSRTQAFIERYGYWTMLLNFFPIIGDTLCVAAGFLRMDLMRITLFVLLTKALRYALVIYVSLSFMS